MRGPVRSVTDRLLSAAAITIAVLVCAVIVLLFVRRAAYRPEPETGYTMPAESGPDGSEIPPPLRQKERYVFLCVGTDRIAGLTDTMMLVSVTSDGAIAVVQLPRDTYVSYRGEDRKLNSIYASDGITGLRRAVEAGLCVNVDYFAAFGTEAFRYAVDAVGGVEIDVPGDMDYDDPEQDLSIHIKAGRQVLKGEDAEGFVRFRSGYARGDLDRMDAQKKFMSSLLKGLIEKTGPSEAARIASSVLPMISTDISAQELLWFVDLVMTKKPSDKPRLTMLTMPGGALYSDELGSSYYVIGREAALETVNTWLNDYPVDVTGEIFDPGHMFVRGGDENFERIYYYAILSPETVTG